MSQADLTEEAINAELELQIENEIEIGDQDMDELQEPPEVDAEGGQEAIFDEVRKALDLLSSSSDPAKSMAYIKDEYEKMNKLFVESRRNESQLVKKCKEMAIELSSSSRKLQTALKLSQTDRANIANLQKENKKAWKHVEINAEKEERNKELIANLKSEIEVLRSGKGGDTTSLSSAAMNRQKLVELQMEQEEEIRKINKEKASLEASYQKDQETIKALQDDLQSSQEKISLNLQEKRAMEEELQILKDFMASKKVETVSFTQLKDKLEQSLKSAMDASEKKDDELKLKSLEMKALKENLARIEKQSQNEKIRSEKFEKENDAFTSKINKIQQDYEDKLSENHKIHNINLELKRTIEIRDDEMNTIKDGLKQVTRLKDGALKKYKQLDEARMNVEIERDTLRSTNAHLAHDIELLKKEIENQAKQLEMVVRERDISQKNFVKSTTATQKQFNVLKLSEQSQRNLEQEIQAYKDEAQKMRKLIYTLEKDRDNRFNEASKLAQLLASQEEDIKMKDMMIFDNKKKISEFEKKLKEQQALYENVRADRNVYSKNLLESQDEISEMKRKVKIMMHQVEQLKEEIAAKEAEKEKEALLGQISKIQQQYDESQQVIQNQKSEETKLRHVINEADLERLSRRKEYDAVIHERDLLGTQIIRRNDELTLLYEKIRIQASTLNKGEIQYRERIEDIRVLRLEIKRLRRERAILQTETQNVEGLRNDIFKLQRDILNERTRVKVLEEELESPLNIHRWRKLAGSDPSTYELISKVQMLQKRLIGKTEEVVEKELIIQQKEKLYSDIKLVLQRQPGPELMEELQIVRQAVKTKNRESKALASELNMYHSQVNEFRYQIENLTRELQEMKRKYYQLRKKQLGKRNMKEAGNFDAMLPVANISSHLEENLLEAKITDILSQDNTLEIQNQKTEETSEKIDKSLDINSSLPELPTSAF